MNDKRSTLYSVFRSNRNTFVFDYADLETLMNYVETGEGDISSSTPATPPLSPIREDESLDTLYKGIEEDRQSFVSSLTLTVDTSFTNPEKHNQEQAVRFPTSPVSPVSPIENSHQDLYNDFKKPKKDFMKKINPFVFIKWASRKPLPTKELNIQHSMMNGHAAVLNGKNDKDLKFDRMLSRLSIDGTQKITLTPRDFL